MILSLNVDNLHQKYKGKNLPFWSVAVCDVPSAELYTEMYKVLRV